MTLESCLKCGLVILSTDQRSFHFEQVEKEFFSEGYLRRRDFFSDIFFTQKARQRIEHISRFSPIGSLIDIGCGTGELISVAQQSGYRAVGLDYSLALVEYVRSRYSVPVYLGDISYELPERFDIAVMAHVIEHTLDPREALVHLRRILKPGGLLYIAVPNIASWEARFRGWGSYEPYHFWYFDPNTLSNLLATNGYEVIDLITWEPCSSWMNTVIRTLFPEEYAAVRTAVHHDESGRLRLPFLVMMSLLNTARFASGVLLTPIRQLQERLRTGEELICLARIV